MTADSNLKNLTPAEALKIASIGSGLSALEDNCGGIIGDNLQP
jgi:hypothetical protein